MDNSIEKEVEAYEKKNGALPAHNKSVLRDMIKKENLFWDKEAVREDSHSPVGDWEGAREVNQE